MGGEEKRSGTEKRCSHNLQSANFGQRRICDLTAGPPAGLFSEVEKDSDLCKNCVSVGFFCWCYYREVKLRKRS